VVEPFEAILIALVHAIEAQVPGTVVGCGGAALADGEVDRAGFGPGLSVANVACALA